MGQDPGQAGQKLDADSERTPDQVREEIEQTRADLGDTVAALAAKTDVKAQAHKAIDNAKATATGKAADLKHTIAAKKDDVTSSAHEAMPPSAGEAGQRLIVLAKENQVAVAAVVAFGVGLMIGKKRAS